MITINIIILAVIALGAVTGFSKGIVRQFGQLAAFILAIVACRAAGGVLADSMMGDDPGLMRVLLCNVAANTLVFAVVYYGVKFVSSMVKTVTHAVALGWLDRLAGALFSIAKWLFGLSLVLNVWVAISPDSPLMDSDGDGVTDEAATLVLDFAPALVDSDTAHQIADMVKNHRSGNVDGDDSGTEPRN